MIKAKSRPIIKLISILVDFLYKTMQVKVNTNKSKKLFRSKYHIPILKQLENMINKIKLIIIIASLLSLLAYQHTYASIGDIRVNPYQIII